MVRPLEDRVLWCPWWLLRWRFISRDIFIMRSCSFYKYVFILSIHPYSSRTIQWFETLCHGVVEQHYKQFSSTTIKCISHSIYKEFQVNKRSLSGFNSKQKILQKGLQPYKEGTHAQLDRMLKHNLTSISALQFSLQLQSLLSAALVREEEQSEKQYWIWDLHQEIKMLSITSQSKAHTAGDPFFLKVA